MKGSEQEFKTALAAEEDSHDIERGREPQNEKRAEDPKTAKGKHSTAESTALGPCFSPVWLRSSVPGKARMWTTCKFNYTHLQDGPPAVKRSLAPKTGCAACPGKDSPAPACNTGVAGALTLLSKHPQLLIAPGV
eukprot:1081602-Pelagomonas_calceolata.AAC.1